MTPPQLWRSLLRRAVPEQDRDSLLHELDLLYGAKARLSGDRAARRWYRGEALAFVLRLPGERLANRFNRPHSTGQTIMNAGRDLRHAIRSLAVQPTVTAVCLLALVLGIGANTMVFTIVDHVVLRPLPYTEPDRLVQIWPEQFLLRGEIDFFEQHVEAATGLAVYLPGDGFNAVFPDGSRRLRGNYVNPELLQVLGVEPIRGRNFNPAEDQPGRSTVALISHSLWRTEFSMDDSVIGTTLPIDGVSHEIVGVLPPEFGFPDREQELLLPVLMNAQDPGAFWGSSGYRAVARLQDGASTTQLRDELFELSKETRLLNPLWTPREDFRAEGIVIPLRDALVGNVESNLLVLLGAVLLMLLVSCANVGNLLLARTLSRSHDIALRNALGASRSRILVEQILESLVLVALGCGLAVAAAWAGLDLMVRFLPPEIPRANEIALDGRVLGISVAMALVAGVLASVLPALRAARTSPSTALRESSAAAGTTAHRRRLSSALVMIQVSAGVVLVLGAGLLIRSLGQLYDVDPGFDTDRVSTARLTLNPVGYETAENRLALFQQVVDRLRAEPGVQSVGAAGNVPFGTGWGGMATFVEDADPDPNNLPIIRHIEVLPGYFESMGIELLRGRAIEPGDVAGGQLVAVIDATMADRFWPQANPIGGRIRYPWRGAPWITVVGVVGGTAEEDLAIERRPAFYVPAAQRTPYAMNVVVRRAPGATFDVGRVRALVGALDSSVPISGAVPVSALVAGSLARATWSATLLAGFAVLTLVLGCIGVYGVVAYSVGQRSRDFGVRMALGAAPGNIRSEVLGQGLRLAIPGVLVGLALAVPATRLLASLLYGIEPLDPATFATVPAVLVATTLAACFVPARRATRVDPSTALRRGG